MGAPGAGIAVGWDDGALPGHGAVCCCGFGASVGHGKVCAPAAAAEAATMASANAKADLWVIVLPLPTGSTGSSFQVINNTSNPVNPATTRQTPWRGAKSLTRTGLSARYAMARYDFHSPRLYVDEPLAAGAAVTLEPSQAHYLADVLRLKPGDPVLVFNGRDGEWRATLTSAGKRTRALAVETQTRAQTPPGDLHYLFAPLKRTRLDYLVQKAVEMGVSRLQPVMTRHTQSERVKAERMRANAIEAAEQCGVLRLPDILEPAPLARALDAVEPSRLLVFCDEDAPTADPVAALAAAAPRGASLALLIGPEGGYAEEERTLLLARPHVVRLALGPRILRADTAAVAALALVQAVLGDWRGE